jgi:MFS family permease
MCGLGRGLASPFAFYIVVALYLIYGIAVGVALPVKQAYVNDHIPSAERATILSLDAMFGDAGGVVGQSGWGWLASKRSIGEAWTYAGATLLLGLPLYWLARRGERAPHEAVVA